MTTKKTSLLLALAALSAVALSGCTSSDDSSALSGSSAKTIDMKDFAFPGTVTVPAGATVTWVNRDDAMHTVTAADGSFDSGAIDGGGSWSHTFTEPGTYSYYCKPHASKGSDGQYQGMVGKIVVT